MKKIVNVGAVPLGGGSVKIQSMATAPTCDAEKTAAQLEKLAAAGCDLVRVAVRDERDARAIAKIKNLVSAPLVADIHFSAALAVLAIESGADKVRVNPGNVGGEKEIKRIADCLRAHRIPVRVGANSGSLEKNSLKKYGKSAEALVESALENVAAFEKYGVNEIVVSVKASSVPQTVAAYRLLASRTEYPLHVGVTEAGAGESGVVKSSIGIGALLLDGIGDTIRVSLAADPLEEVYAAKRILRACGLRGGVDVIACPTCGRCEWESMRLARTVEELAFRSEKNAKIAVMGCVVNGPGEAADADLGIAGGKGYCALFEKGKIVRKIPAEDAERVFLEEVKKLLGV